MDKKLQQGMEWLTKEMKKDDKAVQNHKKKLIDEIKKIDRTKMLNVQVKPKISFITKLSIILGWKKKETY